MRTGIEGFLQRHPVASYFALTFAISWGAIFALILGGQTGWMATADQFQRLLPYCVPLLVLGPSLSGILMTWLVGGRAGLRAYRARLFKWRVEPRWYAVALLTAPLYVLVVGLVLAPFSPAYLPGIFTTDDLASYLVRGMMVALTAGIVEELGWTGFATPMLRRRHGSFATGLIVGVSWGLWHVLPKIWGSDANGLVPYMPVDLLCALVGLSGYRVLMVWVHDRTESLLIGILMHTGLTAATLILQTHVPGEVLIRLSVVLAAVPWLIVAAVAAGSATRARRPAATPCRRGGSGRSPLQW
jgi:uncharacterized protein